MTGCVVGSDRRDAIRRADRLAERNGRPDGGERFLEDVRGTWVVGSVEEAVAHLRALEGSGVDRVMLQLQDHEDLELVEVIGRELVPALASA
jgi:alkanesulfonate monooxygenase SsuD/methylene tetrahydromethanopterin reductase-like flavin-dependent oxidoreductase (luciferase family)